MTSMVAMPGFGAGNIPALSDTPAPNEDAPNSPPPQQQTDEARKPMERPAVPQHQN